MVTTPISSSSSPHSPLGNTTVKVGQTDVPCYDGNQANLTRKVLQNEQVGFLQICAKHLTIIDPDKVDASPTTIFTLANGLADALPGKHFTPFHDPEHLVKKVDPTGAWAERAGPDGRGDTLQEFSTHLQDTLKVMGLSPVPSIKPEHIAFKTADLSAQHVAEDKFRNVMSKVADPAHGETHIVVVNCDQALAINGAMKQKVSEGELGGNYCIVGGYDRDQELVLLLDLDKSYPADGSTPAKNSGIYWVPLSDLVAAMNTPDTDSKMNRGYLAFSIPTT